MKNGVIFGVKMKTNNDLEEPINKYEDLNYISNIIKEAGEFGIEAEVVWSAMLALKKNPKMSISDAMENRRTEWLK